MTYQLDVTTQAKAASYLIQIQSGLHQAVASSLLSLFPKGTKLLLVTDSNTRHLFGNTMGQNFTEAGFAVYPFTVQDGEHAKSLSVAESLYSYAIEVGLSREDVMIALGGGVVGDLVGFCAATYFRGIPFVQIPTTLLAQVDSSVGGKVAVNFQSIKNAIGAFYQPKLVLIDPDCLRSLPNNIFKAGLGEVVKYALIETTCSGTSGLFDWLSGSLKKMTPENTEQMSYLVHRCCQIKAEVVRQDELEQTGLRMLLNLGHTFAHAYEEATSYDALQHGEAVTIGLIDAARLTNRLGLFSTESLGRLVSLCEQMGLTFRRPEGLDSEALLALMRHDKKASHGNIRLVLPTDPIGTVMVRDDVSDALILEILLEAF
jgi:3-dehydroquinate synthase